MGVEYTFSSECISGSAVCHATYIIRSDGWSGKVIKTSGDTQEDRTFKFHGHMTISGSQDGTLETSENAYIERNETNVSYIGISIEHFGEWWITGWSHEKKNQIIGLYPLGETPSNPGEKPAYGARSVDNVPSFTAQGIIVEGYTNNITSQTYGAERVTNIAIGTSSGYRGLMSCEMKPGNGGGWIYDLTVEIDTDLPIFETDADLMVYCNSRGEDTSTIKNIADPEEEYTEQFDFWFVKNKWGHNTRNVDSSNNTAKNYRFYPKRKGICFIKHTPTASEPYDRILYNYSGYDPYYAAWGETADEDFGPNPGTLTTHFLTKSISFGPTDYYTKFDFDTNIPLWDTQQDADDYFAGLKDITEADNYAYIARQDNAILNPDLPGTDIDESTTLGTNGMRYSYGNRLYEITNVELSNLMTELFQPANVQSVIDGNKLFGSNTMEAVSGAIYIPLTSLDAVCEMGSLANVRIGSWESQNAQGRRIIKNEGTIDCGTFFYNRVYNDYRDYEPYNLLFANLPFCGCHQLTISKYLDKTVGVSYNIDITTGAIVCKLTADGLLVDIFDGTCGASRPISATDNNAYINNVVGAITGASSQASGAIEGITNTVDVVGKATSAGAVATGGAALGGALFAGGIAASGVYTAYQIKNAVDNPPQMHRGSLVGNLAYTLNTKPTFLFYSKRTIRPENELAVVGYPSGHGGTIGTFNGFLSCGAVKLANFNGTKAEESELFEILKGGIYI